MSVCLPGRSLTRSVTNGRSSSDPVAVLYFDRSIKARPGRPAGSSRPRLSGSSRHDVTVSFARTLMNCRSALSSARPATRRHADVVTRTRLHQFTSTDTGRQPPVTTRVYDWRPAENLAWLPSIGPRLRRRTAQSLFLYCIHPPIHCLICCTSIVTG